MKRVFLDTETTGLTPGNIAQLSMIILNDNGEITAKNYFFDIDYLSDGAAAVCNRTLDDYKEASKGKRFVDYKDEIYNILTDAVIIAHNESFDENFISTEFWRLGIMFQPTERFCTMKYFKDIMKMPPKSARDKKYKNPKLAELVGWLNINEKAIETYSKQLFGDEYNTGFHDARFDTTAMFVAVQVHNDNMKNTNEWINQFCNK